MANHNLNFVNICSFISYTLHLIVLQVEYAVVAGAQIPDHGTTFVTLQNASQGEFYSATSLLRSLSRCSGACQMSDTGCSIFEYEELTGLSDSSIKLLVLVLSAIIWVWSGNLYV